MPGFPTGNTPDRRRIASPWFKRRIAARFIVTGVVVFAAVCIAFGGVGIGVGVVVLAGVGVLLHLERKRQVERRLSHAGRDDGS
jgi:hypothetical protein